MQPCGRLFIFSGPSGVGKNAIMNKVMDTFPALKQLPTATTRAQRAYEQQGREHEFLTETEFRQRILSKSLIEWQIIHDKGVYGVPRQTIQRAIQAGQPLIADVDVLGAMQLKEEFGEHVVLIFVEAPDKATLEARLRGRSDYKNEDDLSTRMRRVDFELTFAEHYDHRIVNQEGDLDSSVAAAIKIVDAACQETLTTVPGWNPAEIVQSAQGFVLQDGHVLLQDDQFPQTTVPDAQMPFEALQSYFREQLAIEILPTRQNAVFRKVPVGFEPAQLVDTQRQPDGVIQRQFIYVLRSASQLEGLPDSWKVVPISSLDLTPTIQDLLDEAANTLALS